MVFAYIGPDTVVPVSSALAVATGAVLAFWPRVKSVAGRGLALITGRKQPSPPEQAQPAESTADAVQSQAASPE